MTRIRRLVSVAIAAAASVGILTAVAEPAAAAPPSYVALGDSYSSGVGTRSSIEDGSGCHRSLFAYPELVAATTGYALSFQACSGATVADVTRSQLGALSAGTAYVTISVGGNDSGFAGVLTACALPSWAGNCTGAVDGAQRYVAGVLPGSLRTLYASIRARAPRAKVVVVGYPRLFNGIDCNPLTFFTSAEMTRLNQTADLLDRAVAAAAAGAGFGYVEPVQAFTHHAVCDQSPWLNGLTLPVTESYHPNRAGQANGYAPLVTIALARMRAPATLAR